MRSGECGAEKEGRHPRGEKSTARALSGPNRLNLTGKPCTMRFAHMVTPSPAGSMSADFDLVRALRSIAVLVLIVLVGGFAPPTDGSRSTDGPESTEGPSTTERTPNPRAADERPNIVYIMADDMGFSDVGMYGATRIETDRKSVV